MPEKFIEKVKKTISKYNMLEKDDTVLAGVSGGPDSVALLYILKSLQEEFNLNIFVVHVNHMFRGEEADREADFVLNLAIKWGIKCKVYKENVPALIKAKGLSPQDAGHQVRKEIFMKLGKDIKADKLALGHHADDRAETILLHLIQGTGMDGLASMPPRHNWLIRPLAEVTKEEITDFCKKKGLTYCLDPSNDKPVYLRNKIRLKLLPILKRDFNIQIVEGLLKLEDIIWVENNYMESQVDNIFSEVVKYEKGKISLSLKEFNRKHLAVKRRLIRKIFKVLRPEEQSLNYFHVEQILQFAQLNGTSKKINLPSRIWVKKKYKTLEFLDEEIHKVNTTSEINYNYELNIPGEIFLPLQGKTLKVYYSEENIGNTDYLKVVLDGEKITSPLVVRKRMPGDRIQPLGMTGTKKIKDLFIDRKIDKEKRDLIPMVCSEKDIIWIPGLTINEKYKVTSNTKRFLIIELRDNINV